MADQNRAQKSEVHENTDDAASSPASNFERGAADADIKRNPEATAPDGPGGTAAEIGEGLGAGDGSSGGGAGSGIPGGGTDLRTNGAFSGGDVRQDREKLFPETARGGRDPRDAAPPGATIESDESDDGGPDADAHGRRRLEE